MEGDHNTHGSPLPKDEIDATKENLGLMPESFNLPEKVKTHFQTRFEELHKNTGNWKTKLESL